MKKLVFFIMTTLMSLPTCYSQSFDTIQPRRVGDFVPNVSLKKLLNYKVGSANLDEFKGKLLIIDFWATWCGPCVASMPKLDSLRRQFGDEIEILVVTTEKIGTVSSFMKNRKENLTIVAEDTALKYMFLHRSIPHVVLVSPTGQVAAITDAVSINATNIEQVLRHGKYDQFFIKTDIITFNKRKPIFSNVNPGNEEEIVFRSLVSKHMDGVGSGIGITELDSARVGISCRNNSIPHLFLYSMNQPTSYINSRLVFKNVQDTGKYTRDQVNLPDAVERTWTRKNNFCYDLIAPAGFTRAEQLAIMKQTLDQTFKALYNVSIYTERMLRPCLALVVKDSTKFKRIETTNLEKAGGSMMDRDVMFFQAFPIEEICQVLETNILLAIVDDTGFKGRINMELDGNVLRSVRKTKALKPLHKALNDLGLALVPTKRVIEVLVIEEGASSVH